MREIAASSPGDFLKAFPDGAIIDEAQKVPEIFDSIKLVVDSVEYQPEKYILTGSSQFRLRENITDRMAGRIALLNLLRVDTKEELLLDNHKGAAVETMAVSELLKSRWNTEIRTALRWTA